MNMDKWLIVGLGNPGEKYAATRHNIGFMVIDRLAEQKRAVMGVKENSSIGKARIGDAEVVLLKPLNYMNLSGTSVRRMLAKCNLIRGGEIHNLIVIHDDLDLPPGIIKIRRGGSSGGHKGIESLIRETGSADFIRIKIGIGRDNLVPAEDYVLRRFKPAEKKMIEDGLTNAAEAVEEIIMAGLAKAMTRFNRNVKPEKQGKA
jgi:PTH1 family peptidyl-tRNA hydrolase